jgi:hypothetical protein
LAPKSKTINSIKGQMFDGAGAKVGGEFQIDTAASNYNGDVAGLANGGFVITFNLNYSPLSTYAQIFDASGVKISAVFLVTTGGENPNICALPDGGFVVASADKAQVFDATGARVGVEFPVHTEDRHGSDMCALANGSFVNTWTDASDNVWSQLYDGEGGKLSASMRLALGVRLV